jgi:hypothetical protein
MARPQANWPISWLSSLVPPGWLGGRAVCVWPSGWSALYVPELMANRVDVWSCGKPLVLPCGNTVGRMFGHVARCLNGYVSEWPNSRAPDQMCGSLVVLLPGQCGHIAVSAFSCLKI